MSLLGLQTAKVVPRDFDQLTVVRFSFLEHARLDAANLACVGENGDHQPRLTVSFAALEDLLISRFEDEVVVAPRRGSFARPEVEVVRPAL